MEATTGGSSEERRVPVNTVTGGGGAFKKLIIDTGDNHLRSTAHAVVSNDDLLIEILLRLPVISLHMFKIVSKRWLSLITNPNFIVHRTKIPNLDPPSGLFLRRHTYPLDYDFVQLDNRIPANKTPFNTTGLTGGSDGGNVTILQSCNGLLLCRNRHENRLYVCNPSVNRFIMLPYVGNPNLRVRFGSLILAFDPTKSPHYKVVYARIIPDIINDPFIRIRIFSSETCNWSVCDDRFQTECFKGFSRGVYWNDAINWLDDKGTLLYKLDVDRISLSSMQTPVALDERSHSDHKLFESCGSLVFICMVRSRYVQRLNVYEMRKGYSEWSVKYLVDVDDIMTVFPRTWKMPGKIRFNVLCVVLGKKEEDSYLVIELCGKVVQYKIVLNALSKLFDLVSNHPYVKNQCSFDSFPFIASFASV